MFSLFPSSALFSFFGYLGNTSRRLPGQNNVMFTGRAESRYVSISQALQSYVEPLADRLRDDCTVEERERPEAKRFASNFVEFETR